MIHVFSDRLVQRGKVLSNPAVDLVVMEDDVRPLPTPPLSEEQVRYLFEMLHPGDAIDCGNRLHVELLYVCALRPAESLSLTIDDHGFAERVVFVRGGKGDKGRMVPNLGGVTTAAKDYLAIRRELLCGPDHGLLLLGKNGQRLPLDDPVVLDDPDIDLVAQQMHRQGMPQQMRMNASTDKFSQARQPESGNPTFRDEKGGLGNRA